MDDTSAAVNTASTAEPSLSAQLLALQDALPESLKQALALLNQHAWLAAMVIALLSFLLAVTLRSLLARLLGRLTGLNRTPGNTVALDMLRKPVFLSIFLLGMSFAVAVAQLPMGSDVIVRVLFSVVTLSWMVTAVKLATFLLSVFSGENRFKLIDTHTVPLFDLTSKLLVIMVGSYILLIIWGINPIGWLASAGIAGLAIGFAAKDTLANLFSGFFIVADAPYKIGDYINLDSGERGKVSAIGMRSTRLLTRDDVEITIPNGVIANAKIINESGGPQTVRMRVVLSVAYGSDVDQVSELLVQIGKAHPEVCDSPEPRVRLRGFGASGLDFNLMCWITKPEDRGRIAHELHMTIYKTFGQHKIEIPYAKQDLYIKQWPSRPTDWDSDRI